MNPGIDLQYGSKSLLELDWKPTSQDHRIVFTGTPSVGPKSTSIPASLDGIRGTIRFHGRISNGRNWDVYGASWHSSKRKRRSSTPTGSVSLALKVCVPGERESDWDDDADPVKRYQSYYDAVLREARLYDGRLRPLQGTVVPNYYGLWEASVPFKKETAYIMLLECVEDTIISHSIPGGR